MGLTGAKVRLRNPRLPDLEPVETDALADTGSAHLCIPRWLQRRLQLEESERKPVTLADGRVAQVPYVGPLELRVREPDRVHGRAGHGRATPAGGHSHGGHGPGRRSEDAAGHRQSGKSRRGQEQGVGARSDVLPFERAAFWTGPLSRSTCPCVATVGADASAPSAYSGGPCHGSRRASSPLPAVPSTSPSRYTISPRRIVSCGQPVTSRPAWIE